MAKGVAVWKGVADGGKWAWQVVWKGCGRGWSIEKGVV